MYNNEVLARDNKSKFDRHENILVISNKDSEAFYLQQQ